MKMLKLETSVNTVIKVANLNERREKRIKRDKNLVTSRSKSVEKTRICGLLATRAIFKECKANKKELRTINLARQYFN